ncbi:reverse transcriptase domain-containing protein [Tanacetum coccineum]
MSVRLADKSFQYPVRIAENMLVEVGKFTFPADFVILEMEEDSKVPLILGRPFLHTADAIIRVKQKQLNLEVGTERMIFNIDSIMKHSYLNDDTCFSIDVINEILEEDFDALLDEAMTTNENFDSESDTEEPPFEKITINTDYKIKTSLEEPPTDLELKPLPDNLEYVFLEEPSFLLVIISSQLSKERKANFYFQILIDPNDQEKTTFTCPFRTYAYRRMPFGLCNAPATFQRYFLKIARPLTKLLEKDTPFEFNNECQKAFELLKEKLTCAPVIISLNWNLPFELMCDASDFAVGVVLEFDIEIKDIKGTENVVANHLSRIENDETSDDSEVDDNFPGETLMEINTKDEPWFADFANYLVGDIIPKGMTYQQKSKFFFDLKHYFREEPYLFKVCSDVTVDYVSKWAEAQALPTNDARVVVTFLKKLLCRFGMPKALISDRVEDENLSGEPLREDVGKGIEDFLLLNAVGFCVFESSEQIGLFVEHQDICSGPDESRQQTDGEAMINSIKNGEHPLHVVAQVPLTGTTSDVPPPLKDLKFSIAEEKKN